MKTLLTLFTIIILAIACKAQPNTSTTIEVGIVNPLQDKTYKVFMETSTAQGTSRLQDGMDYLDPNVNDLSVTLKNYHTVGDTLFGEIYFQDQTVIRYVKAGLVQVNNLNQKYSAMRVTNWVELDTIEPNAAGFFIRKKVK